MDTLLLLFTVRDNLPLSSFIQLTQFDPSSDEHRLLAVVLQISTHISQWVTSNPASKLVVHKKKLKCLNI